MVLVVESKYPENPSLSNCERSFSAALSCFLRPEISVRRWLIAHSGGVDSQLLLYLACKTFPKKSIAVVHINHHLQDSADEWAAFSENQARYYGVEHIILNASPSGSSENAAREERYRLFDEVVEEGDVMLLGHHADDQAETLLFRMLRGSGLAGMGGMPSSRALGKGTLSRPLLKCTRAQIEAAAEELSLDYVTDPSNAKDDYDRNFLRNQVLPLLQVRWPKLNLRWSENAEHLREANELLESYLDADMERCSPAPEILDLDQWSVMGELKQAALLRHWVLSYCGLRLNKQAIEIIYRDVINADLDADPKYSLGKAVLRRFRRKLYLVNCLGQGLESIRIETNGSFDLGDGELNVSGLPQGSVIQIRRRQGGERCAPVGKNSKPVKKILQESAIPPWYRERWPLAYVDDQLIAVPGVCLCQGFGIEENRDFSILWRPF